MWCDDDKLNILADISMFIILYRRSNYQISMRFRIRLLKNIFYFVRKHLIQKYVHEGKLLIEEMISSQIT